MVDHVTPKPADLAALVEYLDGNLDEEAMLAFEERLELEPALARALDDFEGIDRLQRESVGRRSVGEILGEAALEDRRKPLALGLALAAGFLALVSAATWFLVGRDTPQSALGFEVAALGIEEASPESVNRLLGLEDGWLPTRMRGAGGPEDPDAPSEPEYLLRALTAQEARAHGALGAGSPSVDAGRFSLVLRPEQDAWAVVVSVPRSGRPARLFPVEGDPASGERLQAKQVTFLPRPFVAEERAADGSPRAGFGYGFLVPLGAGELRVLTALSALPLTDELLGELDRRLDASAESAQGARSLTDWLEEHGFSVSETLVVEEL